MIEALASFILGIGSFFANFNKWFNDFYDDCADYVYRNIRNGKVFYDLGVIQKKIIILTLKFFVKEYKSPGVQNAISEDKHVLQIISEIPVIHKFLLILIDSRNVYKKNSKFLIIFLFLIIFPITILSINLLNSSPAHFFIYLIPIALTILFIESCLYIYIEKKEKNEKISIAKSFSIVIPNFYSAILLFLFYILLTTSVILLLILLVTFSFQYITILENNIIILFIFLLFVIFIIVSLIFLIFYLTVIFYQSYFLSILDNKQPVEAIAIAGSALKKNILSVGAFSVIIIFSAVLLELFAFIYFSDIALQFVNALIIHYLILFFYGIRRVYLADKLNSVKAIKHNKLLFISFAAVILVGVIGYTALASFTLKYYSNVAQFYTTWIHDQEMSRNFQTLLNEEDGYMMLYPKTWQIYQWNEKSITLNYNDNNTSSGIISVNIEVVPISKTDYYRYEQLIPGTIIEDLDTKENFTMDAKLYLAGYNAVKYKIVKIVPGINRYEINYLILKGDKVYKISLITANSIFQQTYTKTFDTMINTFKFL